MIPNADNSNLSRASWGRVYTLLEDSTQNHYIKNESYGTTVQGLNKFSEHTGLIKYSDGIVPTTPSQSGMYDNYIPQNIREDSMFGSQCTDIYAKYTFISDDDSNIWNSEYPSHFICFPDNGNGNAEDVGNLFNTKTATIHFQFKPFNVLDDKPIKIAMFGAFDIWYFPKKLNIYHYFNGDHSILKQTSNNFAIFNKNYYNHTSDGIDINTDPKEFELDEEGNPSLNATYYYNGSAYFNTGKDKDENFYSVISLVGAFNVERKDSGFYDITIDLIPYTDIDLSTKIYENIFIYQKTDRFERIGIDNILCKELNGFISSLDGYPIRDLMYLLDPENILPFTLEFYHGEFGDIYVSSEHALYDNSVIAPTLGTVNNYDYYIITDVEEFYNNNTTWLFLDKIRVSDCTDIKDNYKPSAKLKENGSIITIEKIKPGIPGVIEPFHSIGAFMA